KVLCDLAGIAEAAPEEKTAELEEKVAEPEEKTAKPKEKIAKPAKKAAAAKKTSRPKTDETVEKEKPSEPLEQNESSVIRVSLNLDLDIGSDPDLKDLVMKLLKQQLDR
ncbi:hypothetical protein DRQ25_13910, partial [Candidatus Fermentibacteria bacterium]